jgi:hypothetical protein
LSNNGNRFDRAPRHPPGPADTARSTVSVFPENGPLATLQSSPLSQASPIFSSNCDWDKSATDRACPTDADRTPGASAMDKEFPYQLRSTKKAARKRNGLCRTELSDANLAPYSAEKNFRMRSRPRSNSAFEVAYETRMCSLVPKPSPGTVATCASRNSRPATSDADFSPPRGTTKRSDKHRTRLPAACTSRPESRAVLSPHDRAARCIPPHLLDALLRSLQRSHRGLLHNRSRIRGRLALQFRHRAHHSRRCQRVSQPPSGHGISLRQRSQHHHALLVFAQRPDRKILAV